MLEVKCPRNYEKEREYICKVIFEEFLGVEYNLIRQERPDWLISAGDNKKLRISDVFFKTPKESWLKNVSLPRRPLKIIFLKNTIFEGLCSYDSIPALYGEIKQGEQSYVDRNEEIDLKLDILGASFFMLTRYEEIVNTHADIHGRYPSKKTIAYQEGFLERPLVNEYLELLWCCINKLWPNVKRKKRQFQIRISHDVDRSYLFHNLKYSFWIKHIAGDLLYRKNLSLAYKTLKNGLLSKLNRLDKDPFDTYDWLMDMSENNSIKSEFYFICGGYGERFGPNYQINDTRMTDLIRHISDRGHNIGIHPSYKTYLYPKQLSIELEALNRALNKVGITPDKIGGRQHYYRWVNPTTWQIWEDNGLSYDSSLAFDDYVGFRCGTCYEFSVFNLKTSMALNLKERPLIISEDTLFNNEGYSILSYEDKCQKGDDLKNVTRKYGGVFEVLWHNDGFYGNENLREFYKNILSN